MNLFFIILAYTSLFALGMCDTVRAPLFPELMQFLRLDDATGSWFFVAASLLGIIASYFSRFLLQIWGAFRCLQLGLLIMSVAILGSSFIDDFLSFILWSCLFGFSVGLLTVVQNLITKNASDERFHKQTFAGLHAMYGLSSLLAPLMVSLVYWQGGNWQHAFVLASLVPTAALAITFLPRFRLEGAKLQVQQKTQPTDAPSHLKEIFLAVVFGFYVIAELSLTTRLVLYLDRVYNFSLIDSSFRLSLYFVLLLGGRLLFAWKSFPFSIQKQVTCLMLLASLCFFMGLWVHPLFLSLCGLPMAGIYPLLMAYLSKVFAKSIESAMSYSVTVLSVLVVLMHFSIGQLTELYGIHVALHLGLFGLLVSLGLFWIFETKLR